MIRFAAHGAAFTTNNRTGHDLCRPGGDRDRERAAVRRGAGAHARAFRTLEQQTATSEVLRSSRSPGELEPVFEAMLTNGDASVRGQVRRLFNYTRATAGSSGSTSCVPPPFVTHDDTRPMNRNPHPTGLGCSPGKAVIHVRRPRGSGVMASRSRRRVVELGGARTFLGVPMLKEGKLVGAHRHLPPGVRPFTDKQIELVQTLLSRPSSPSRTRGFSMNYANRCSSRPPPPTCSRSLAARRSICRPCSTRWSSQRPSFVRRKLQRRIAQGC